MRMQRLILVSALAAAFLVAASAPALAGELEDYLGEANEAVYSGRQVVVTVWGGSSRSAVYDVERAGGMLMVEAGEEQAMIGPGRVRSMGGQGSAVAIMQWSDALPGSRYTLAQGTSLMHLGRAADVVEVHEDGQLRVRIRIDLETAAPLATEVFDAEGRLFRLTSMIRFTPNVAEGMPKPPKPHGDYDVMMPLAHVNLPAHAGGYDRVDAYAGPENSVHAFYSDRLFWYSVFAVDGRMSTTGTDGFTHRVANRDYLVRITPAEIWVMWSSGDRSYVLVGNLPPDHLDRVLPGFPAPEQRNLLTRLWHGLFG